MRDQKNDSFSQEFLLNGVSDRFNWTAGVYYFDETPEELTTGSDSGTPNVFIREEHLDAQSRAIFGEGTYSVTDALNLTLAIAGLRMKRNLRPLVMVRFAAETGILIVVWIQNVRRYLLEMVSLLPLRGEQLRRVHLACFTAIQLD